jgi:hypothetical protein
MYLSLILTPLCIYLSIYLSGAAVTKKTFNGGIHKIDPFFRALMNKYVRLIIDEELQAKVSIYLYIYLYLCLYVINIRSIYTNNISLSNSIYLSR